MSKNRCNDVNEVMQEAYHISQAEAGFKSYNVIAMAKGWGTKKSDKFWSWVNKKYKSKEVITEKELNNFAKKVYGLNDIEAAKFTMIAKIESGLERRPDTANQFYKDAYDYVVANAKNMNLDTTVFMKDTLPDGTFVVDLNKLPYGMVHSLGVKLWQDYFPLAPNADLDTPKNGRLMGVLFEFMLPKNIAKRTTDTSLRDFIKSVTHSAHRRESMERKFTTRNPKARLKQFEYELKYDKQGNVVFKNGKPVYTKNPIRYNRQAWGISQMYDEVTHQYNEFGYKYFKEERQFMEFMHMFMQNRIRVDKDGNMFLKRKWRKKYKGNDPIRREDGSFVYGFSDEEPIIMKDGRMVNYDTIHRDMDYDTEAKTKMPGKTTTQLNISQKKPKIGYSDWHQVLDWVGGIQAQLRNFGTHVVQVSDANNIRYQKLVKMAKSFLDEDQLAEFMDMAFRITEQDPFEIHGLDKIQLQNFNKFYFPRKLTAGNRIRFFGLAREEIEAKIANNIQLLKDENLKISTKSRIKQNQKDLFHDLRTIEDKLSILDNIDTQFDETNSMNPIFLQNYINNFKSVTNMMPHQAYRLDDMVIKDYVSETSRQLERRKVAMDLLDLYIKSKDKPKVRDYAMNMFRRTYQYPDAKGRIMGMTVTDDDLNKLMKTMGFDTNGKHNLNRYLKDMSGIYTGNLLSGIADGYVNYFSVIQDMVNSGTEAWVKARVTYQSNREFWNEKAEKAGLVTFSKYLEGYVDEVLRTEDIEQLKMYQDKIKLMIKKIDQIPLNKLPRSDRQIRLRLSKELTLMEKAMPSKFTSFSTQVAKFAITHKIETETYAKETFSKSIKDKLSTLYFTKSIEETEAELRAISYIIGYQNAQKLFRNHRKVTEENIEQMAREYVYQTQFGLESYLVGESLGSTFTKFLNGITTFRKQKTAWDIEKNKNWMRSYWNPDKILDEAKFRSKKQNWKTIANSGEASARMLLRFMGDVFTMSPKKIMKRRKMLRQVAPDIAQGEQFFMIYGLTTAFMNFMVFNNPVLGAVGTSLRQFVFNNKLAKIGTGFISPFYISVLATGQLAYVTGKSFVDDDEEIEFYDFYKFFRSIYGTGFMDMFVLASRAAKGTHEYISGGPEWKSDETYYTDPSKHGTWNSGVSKVLKKYVADNIVKGYKHTKDEWFTDYDFGHY